jgi:hypothetical protein
MKLHRGAITVELDEDGDFLIREGSDAFACDRDAARWIQAVALPTLFAAPIPEKAPSDPSETIPGQTTIGEALDGMHA